MVALECEMVAETVFSLSPYQGIIIVMVDPCVAGVKMRVIRFVVIIMGINAGSV